MDLAVLNDRAEIVSIGAGIFASRVHGGNWIGSWIRYGLTTAGLIILLISPQIRFPRLLVWPVLTLSAASFHIYLVHRLIPEAFGHDAVTNGLAATVIGLASGLAAFHLHKMCRSLSLRWLGPRPSPDRYQGQIARSPEVR